MWLALGTIRPNLQWQKFPESVADAHLIRASFTVAGTFAQVKSYCWLRRAWTETTPLIVEPAFRVYPKPETIAFDVKIPEAFNEQGLILVDWQVKLGFYRRNFSEPTWEISLEAWV